MPKEDRAKTHNEVGELFSLVHRRDIKL